MPCGLVSVSSPSTSVSVRRDGGLRPVSQHALPTWTSVAFRPSPAPETLPWTVSTLPAPSTAAPALQVSHLTWGQIPSSCPQGGA